MNLPDIAQNGVDLDKLAIQSGDVQYSAFGSMKLMIANNAKNGEFHVIKVKELLSIHVYILDILISADICLHVSQ